MPRVEIRTRRWNRLEYDRLIETGFFRPDDPVGLLGGQLIVAHRLDLWLERGQRLWLRAGDRRHFRG